MKGMWGETLIIFGILAVIGGVLCVMFLAGEGKGYTEGYCAALSGTVLNGNACNVNGKVVGVK